MASQETIRALNFEDAAWESPTGVPEIPPVLGEPRPTGSKPISFTSITPQQPVQPITRQDILEIINQAPLTPTTDRSEVHLIDDSSPDCHCPESDPTNLCPPCKDSVFKPTPIEENLGRTARNTPHGFSIK